MTDQEKIAEQQKTIDRLTQDNARLKAEIKTHHHKTKDQEIHIAASYLNRTEENMIQNIYVAEPILAGVWDLYYRMPEGQRKKKIEPLINKLMEISSELNEINEIIAIKYQQSADTQRYENLLVGTVRVLDTLGGKIRRCESCIDALDRKREIRAELREVVKGRS